MIRVREAEAGFGRGGRRVAKAAVTRREVKLVWTQVGSRIGRGGRGERAWARAGSGGGIGWRDWGAGSRGGGRDRGRIVAGWLTRSEGGSMYLERGINCNKNWGVRGGG